MRSMTVGLAVVLILCPAVSLVLLAESDPAAVRDDQQGAAPTATTETSAKAEAADEGDGQAGAGDKQEKVAEKPKGKSVKRILRIAVPAVALGGGFAVYRHVTRNLPPVATITGPTPLADGLAGLTSFQFDGGPSSDPNKDSLTYTWAFGDGRTGTGARVTHVYLEPGSYAATLTVSDGKLTSTSTARTVVVGRVTASVDSTAAGLAGMTSYHFEGRPTSDPDGDTLTFTWTFGDGTTATGPIVDHVFDIGGSFTPELSVSDTSGNTTRVALSRITIGSLDGIWWGAMHGFGVRVDWCMELEQRGTSVTGRFADVYEDGTLTGTITPSLAVSLTVTQPSYAPFSMQGWVDQTLQNGGGTVLNYFVGGPGTFDMAKKGLSCWFSSASGRPSVRPGTR